LKNMIVKITRVQKDAVTAPWERTDD